MKNGAPAHVLTTEDRRKAAATTNEIRRAKREHFERMEELRELDAWIAKREARKQRKREQERRRREQRRWLEQGYGETLKSSA